MKLIYLPFIAVLLGLFFKVLVALRARDQNLSPILGWTIGLGFFLLAPLTIIVLNGGYYAPSFYDVSDSHANVDLSSIDTVIPFFVIWTCLLLSLLTLLLLLSRKGNAETVSAFAIDDRFLKKVIIVTSVLAIIDYAGTIVLLGGIEKFLLTNWYLRGVQLIDDLGVRYVLYLWVAQANQTVFTAAAVLYTHSQIRRGVFNWRFTSLLLLLFLFHIAFQGERIYLALYLLSVFTSCWLYHRKRIIVGLLIATPVLALVFSAWAFFRNAPTEIADKVPVYIDADLGNKAVTVLMDACDGTDTIFLFHVINDFGNKYSFLYGASYTRALTFVIPRSLYPDKPQGFAIQLAEIYEPGVTTSFAATELGELYANFGMGSIFLLPLLTLAVWHGTEMLKKRAHYPVLTSAVLFLLMIWVVRSTIEDNFITFVLAAFLIRVLRLEHNLSSPQNSVRSAVPA